MAACIVSKIQTLQLISHISSSTVTSIINSVVSKQLCHFRLGHPSLNVLNKISSLHFENNCILTCDVCPLAKQTRAVFPRSVTKATKLLHCDLWGPYKYPHS